MVFTTCCRCSRNRAFSHGSRRHGNSTDVESHSVKFGPPGSGSGSRDRAAGTVDAGNQAPAAKSAASARDSTDAAAEAMQQSSTSETESSITSKRCQEVKINGKHGCGNSRRDCGENRGLAEVFDAGRGIKNLQKVLKEHTFMDTNKGARVKVSRIHNALARYTWRHGQHST